MPPPTGCLEHASQYGADATRLIVCGDSAGGNLAAGVTLMSRDRGGPEIGYQILMYPTLAPTRRGGFDSHRENAEGYGLTRGGMEWFWGHYLQSNEDGLHPYASPLLADDVSGLPPAFVVAAEFDVL
jgi:acetyl esterase